MRNFTINQLPTIPAKPRNQGITMVMEYGFNRYEATNMLHGRSDMIDVVKLPWGSAYILPTEEVIEKINIYKQAGIDVLPGGTLFEAIYIRHQVQEYRDWLKEIGVTLLEISDGSIELARAAKLKEIRSAISDGFKVISEVGSKDPNEVWPINKWVDYINEELDHGAWKVIIEGRGNGNSGIYEANGTIRKSTIEGIANAVDINALIWEAPSKPQQDYLINHFGANVNIGNVNPSDIVGLRATRLGLRGDTLHSFINRK